MKSSGAAPSTIDEYIRQFPREAQEKLAGLRATIRKAAPDATEKISYGMPTFFQTKNLVHFSAYQHHIGFYPTPSAITGFRDELSAYVTSKGAIQLPIDEPLPLDLVARIVKSRVAENEAKASAKKSAKTAKRG